MTSAPTVPLEGSAPEAEAVDHVTAAERLLPHGSVVASRYRIKHCIGHGGMAYVYLARHIEIDAPVAVKVLRPDLEALSTARERFALEARATAAVQHPNVVQIYDYGALPSGIPFMVMEYLSGTSLDRVLADAGSLPWSRAAAIATQVCAALTAAHERGVIHCDVKPANIVVARGPRGQDFVKLVDFGIATTPTEHAEDDAAIGTPLYMAPEQSGRGSIDQRTDIYAVGVLLQVMLEGRRPAELSAWPSADTSERVDREPEVAASSKVIRRATESDPAQRFASMRELSDAIASARLRPTEGEPASSSRFLGMAAALLAIVLACAMATPGDLELVTGVSDEPVHGAPVSLTARSD